MNSIPLEQLQEHFNKFDNSSKKYLTPEEYLLFATHIVSSYTKGKDIKVMLDEKLKEHGKITLQDLSESNKLVFSLHHEERIIAPSTAILQLLKRIKESEKLNIYDKELIDWGIDAVLNGKIYQTELATNCIKPFAEERKITIIPWMEVFSTPNFDSSLIELQRESPYRRTSVRSILDFEISIGLELQKLDDLSFNIFEYEKVVGRQKVLPFITYNVLKRNNVLSYIDEKSFWNFIEKVQDGYKDIPYHNSLHASDVVQLCNFLLQNGFKEIAKLDNLDVLALIISAAVHDFKHPGVSNNYLINVNSDLALLYNDQSVLENYHVSEAFKLLWRDEECKLFGKLTDAEQKILRKRIIGSILATDNAKHFEHLSWLERMISGLEISKGKNAEKIINRSNGTAEFESKQRIMMICLHLADVSNPTRVFKIAQEWGRRVAEEFYLQGDYEKHKGMPISMSCDRETGNLPKLQMGFITGISRPYVEKAVEIFPKLQIMLDNVSRGYQEWAKLAKEQEFNPS